MRRASQACRCGGRGNAATEIGIRWPGGKTTTSAIPAGAKEITVDTDGKLTLNR
jgi:hypothetical protein